MMEEDILDLLNSHPDTAFTVAGITEWLGVRGLEGFCYKTLRKLSKERKIVYLGRGAERHSHIYASHSFRRRKQ